MWLAGGVELPRTPGTYAIVFRNPRTREVTAGALGRIRLARGYWVYVGSALGPGGLRARVGRHLRGPARPRWHVDYLHGKLRVVEVWFRTGPARLEHRWARALTGEADGWVLGFGCSDCGCGSHLFYFARRPGPEAVLGGRFSEQKIVALYCQIPQISL